MSPKAGKAIFAAIVIAIIVGLIAEMMYIDSLGEAEGGGRPPADAADH